MVGAGVAGLAFAHEVIVRCSNPNLRIIIVEREEALCIQRRAVHRFLEPTLYDWPLPHWKVNRFPVDSTGFPLSYSRGYADQVVAQWDIRAILEDPRIELQERATAIPHGKPSRDGWLTVQIYKTTSRFGKERRWPLEKIKNCLLVCHAWGIGQERIFPTDKQDQRDGDFSSFGFWEPDCYGSLSEGTKVVISGGGDGAIQDLLRLATGFDTPVKLMEHLWPMNDLWIARLDQAGEHLREYIDDAERAWFTGSREYPRLFWRKLEEAIAKLFRIDPEDSEHPTLWRWRAPEWTVIRNKVCELWRAAGSYRITVAHREATYEHCYPLNRFTAVFLRAFLPEIRVFPSTTVSRVTCQGHKHDGEPKNCVNQPHWVTFDGQHEGQELFSTVICRHGRLESDQANDELIERTRGLIPTGGWRQHLPSRIDIEEQVRP